MLKILYLISISVKYISSIEYKVFKKSVTDRQTYIHTDKVIHRGAPLIKMHVYHTIIGI